MQPPANHKKRVKLARLLSLEVLRERSQQKQEIESGQGYTGTLLELMPKRCIDDVEISRSAKES